MSGLTPAQVSMRDAPTEVQIRVRKRLVAHPFVRERSSCGCDSRARPKVSGQVLADESRHLEHVETFAKKAMHSKMKSIQHLLESCVVSSHRCKREDAAW